MKLCRVLDSCWNYCRPSVATVVALREKKFTVARDCFLSPPLFLLSYTELESVTPAKHIYTSQLLKAQKFTLGQESVLADTQRANLRKDPEMFDCH